eukprot:Blabericola_migrator_1__5751@NODE_2912_length_2213_cov_103_208295_g1827_i0_p1_GENE_NODE_2912_length_2213_cov_103_208295_g1827_i0NODE_2912_length_2213_cov_103_208295_g1827_i0_p1_ORF_typecomplete_len244_score21_17Cytb5/PF00173_28/8_1e13_NODE_2912_length_2213_cov_103_208295_g1827_i012161947
MVTPIQQCPPAQGARNRCAYNPEGCGACAACTTDILDVEDAVVTLRRAGTAGSDGRVSREGSCSLKEVIKLEKGQLIELPKEEGPRLPSARWKTGCNACPYCTDRCDLDDCVRCAIKLQNVKKTAKPRELGGLPEYSICEVVRHNNSESLWVCANNLAYDATPILAWHPGGMKPIMKKIGYDATADFNFHSQTAKSKVWEPLVVGRVRPCKGCPTYVPPEQPSWLSRTLLSQRQSNPTGCSVM